MWNLMSWYTKLIVAWCMIGSITWMFVIAFEEQIDRLILWGKAKGFDACDIDKKDMEACEKEKWFQRYVTPAPAGILLWPAIAYLIANLLILKNREDL